MSTISFPNPFIRFSVDNPFLSLVKPTETFSFLLCIFLVSFNGLEDFLFLFFFYNGSSRVFSNYECFWTMWLLFIGVDNPTYFWLADENFFYIVGESDLFAGDFYINRWKYGSYRSYAAVTLLLSSVSIQRLIIYFIYKDNSDLILLWLIGIETWYFNSASVLQWA